MDPNTNWASLHLSDGQILFYAKTDMIWFKDTSNNVTLVTSALNFTVTATDKVLFTVADFAVVGSGGDEGVTLQNTDQVVGLQALGNLGYVQITSAMSNGAGSIGISMSMGNKISDIRIGHSGSGQIRVEHTGLGGIRIAATGSGAPLDFVNSSGIINFSHAAGKFQINNIPLTLAGGSTGNVLTQQLDGSFSPQAAAAFPGLADGKIWIGDSGGAAVARTLSGDVTVSNTGVTAIGALKVTNAMIAAATIDLTAKVTGILPVANGGTGVNTLLIHGLLIGNTVGGVTVSAVGTNGQLLVGQTTADPLWKTVTGDISMLSSGAATVIAWSGKGLAAAFAGPTAFDVPVYSATGTGTWEVQNFGAWSDFTTVLSQGVSTNIAKTKNYSHYTQHGKMVTWSFRYTTTGTGTAGSAVRMTIPVAEATTVSTACGAGGTAVIAGVVIPTNIRLIGGSGVIEWVRCDTGTTSGVGLSPNSAVAAADVFQGTITYEAA